MRATLTPVAGEVRRLTSQVFDAVVGDGSSNVVCSGLGVWCALSVLACGSAGDTARELESAVGVAVDELPSLVAAVDERLGTVGGAAHALAMWSRVPVYRAYREQLPSVAFGHLGDDTDLDAWTREQTHGLIERFPVSVDASTVLALADAVALWTQWDGRFLEDRTADRPFATDAGTIAVPTMYRRSPAGAVSRLLGITRYDLPCQMALAGEGAEPSFGPAPVARFAMGDPGLDPSDVVVAMLSDATGSPPAADMVDVYLPRFSIRNEHDLIEPLLRMGVESAFRDDADFSRLSPESLAVDQASQAALIDVDEVGVKAAAVTAFAIRAAGAFHPTEPSIMELRFDRPFAFALLDPELDLPLFAGWVADPSQ